MQRTLLVLAAGMGSRYGGLKQLDPVGPSGEVVLDYSVHDATWAGFTRVVFVIRPEFEEEFRRVVVSRYEKSLEVEIVHQSLEDLPEGLERKSDREKPWGTGQAIWAARHAIQGPFLAVNADDFYGMEAFLAMGRFLGDVSPSAHSLRMALVAYPLQNTLSEHGSVSRGICTLRADQQLATVQEYTGLSRAAENRIEGTDSFGTLHKFSGRELVSMNFWGFTPEIFPELERQFVIFLRQGGLENRTAEFYIPTAVSACIASGTAPVSVLESQGRWFGVTYREDRDAVEASLKDLVRQGLYKSPLWNHTQ